jgi:hypothetical protein
MGFQLPMTWFTSLLFLLVAPFLSRCGDVPVATSVLVTGSSQITHGVCCAYTAKILDQNSKPFTAYSDSELSNLGGNLAGSIYSDGSCALALPSLVVKSGNSSVSFYVKEAEATNVNVTYEILLVIRQAKLLKENFSLTVN